MAKVPEFHASGTEDGDEVVFHNQSECPIGKAITKLGTASAGKGYYRTLCSKCRDIAQGYPGAMPL